MDKIPWEAPSKATTMYGTPNSERRRRKDAMMVEDELMDWTEEEGDVEYESKRKGKGRGVTQRA